MRTQSQSETDISTLSSDEVVLFTLATEHGFREKESGWPPTDALSG